MIKGAAGLSNDRGNENSGEQFYLDEELISSTTRSTTVNDNNCTMMSAETVGCPENIESSTDKNIEVLPLEKLSIAESQSVTCEDNLHGLSITSDSDRELSNNLSLSNGCDEEENFDIKGDRVNPFNHSTEQASAKSPEQYKKLGNFLPLDAFGNDELAGSFIQHNIPEVNGDDSLIENSKLSLLNETFEKYSTSDVDQNEATNVTALGNSDPWVKISPENPEREVSDELTPNVSTASESEIEDNCLPKHEGSLTSDIGLKKAPAIENDVAISPLVLDIPGPCEPEDLIEGIIFSANYLGTTQLASNKNSAKNARMFQAQEAVNRIKAPEGESQPTVEVDLFISTSKIKILNADTQETMMSHTLRSISYIADVGDLLVIMAKRNTSNEEQNGVKEQPKRQRIICHVLSSSDSHLIAESIGQCFNVAYQQFLQSNCIEPENLTQADFNKLLDTQEMYHDDLVHYSKQENVKEIWVEKKKGEVMGVAIVESGWGSIIPTVILANLQHGSPIERNGKFSIGDQIMAINSTSMVGLPLQTCHSIIKGLRNQTLVKINIVSCPPVVSVLIKRPDLKHQLGFSVQNGIICSLMRGGIAERGGVRVGHRIIEISNQSVVATPHDRIVQMLVTSVGEIQMKTMPAAMYRLLTGQEQPIYL